MTDSEFDRLVSRLRSVPIVLVKGYRNAFSWGDGDDGAGYATWDGKTEHPEFAFALLDLFDRAGLDLTLKSENRKIIGDVRWSISIEDNYLEGSPEGFGARSTSLGGGWCGGTRTAEIARLFSWAQDKGMIQLPSLSEGVR
jgi:hypothetical protein